MKFIKYLLILAMFMVSLPLHIANASKINLSRNQNPNNNIAFNVRPKISYPGDVVIVQATQAGLINFNGKEYRLHPSGDEFLVFLPIPIDHKPGDVDVFFHPESNPIDSARVMSLSRTLFTVTIYSKKFSTQYLEVTNSQQEMVQNHKKIAEDHEKVQKALSKPIKEALFKGTFTQALKGKITTMFGYTRYVNGTLDSKHLAIDIAAPKGSPVIAPNNGKVVLADRLYLSGNRIIIDHGSDLFSSYSHMSKLNVKAGDMVHKGDIIGWVGSTGFSTGPHLHHAFYVNGYAVNPELFFGTDPKSW